MKRKTTAEMSNTEQSENVILCMLEEACETVSKTSNIQGKEEEIVAKSTNMEQCNKKMKRETTAEMSNTVQSENAILCMLEEACETVSKTSNIRGKEEEIVAKSTNMEQCNKKKAFTIVSQTSVTEKCEEDSNICPFLSSKWGAYEAFEYDSSMFKALEEKLAKLKKVGCKELEKQANANPTRNTFAQNNDAELKKQANANPTRNIFAQNNDSELKKQANANPTRNIFAQNNDSGMFMRSLYTSRDSDVRSPKSLYDVCPWYLSPTMKMMILFDIKPHQKPLQNDESNRTECDKSLKEHFLKTSELEKYLKKIKQKRKGNIDALEDEISRDELANLLHQLVKESHTCLNKIVHSFYHSRMKMSSKDQARIKRYIVWLRRVANGEMPLKVFNRYAAQLYTPMLPKEHYEINYIVNHIRGMYLIMKKEKIPTVAKQSNKKSGGEMLENAPGTSGQEK